MSTILGAIQIAPLCSRSGNPEDAIQNQTVVFRLWSAAGAVRAYKRSKKSPFLITHQTTNQISLPSEGELESRFDRFGHPLCQQNLGTLSFKREVSGRAFEELNKICYGIFSAVIIDDDMVKLDVFRRQVGAIQPR